VGSGRLHDGACLLAHPHHPQAAHPAAFFMPKWRPAHELGATRKEYPVDEKFDYGTRFDNGDIQRRKNLKDARWWARTLSTPNKSTGLAQRVSVVARPVGEWFAVEGGKE
jgi:hypothetical protein